MSLLDRIINRLFRPRAACRGSSFVAAPDALGRWTVTELDGRGNAVRESAPYASKANAVRAAKRLAARIPGAKWKVSPG